MVSLRIIAIVALMGTSAAAAAGAQNDELTNDGIASQPLADAIQEFADKTGLQVIYESEIADNVRSNGAEPAESNKTLLDQLLASTGVGYVFLNDRTVALQLNDGEGGGSTPRVLPAPASQLMAQNQNADTQTRNAPAQDNGDERSSAVLEEVVVTARRYEENIGDVPVSVNVMSAEYLEAGGLSNVRDVIDFSPGGVSTSFNKMQDEYSLRGVSSQTEGPSGDSSVATVIDSVPITREFMKSQAFFDMQSIEILRGPQGTSFGRNASSGLIHLKTARPRQEFGSSITAEVGSDEQYRVEGFITGAIGQTAAGRLAVHVDSLNGFITDTRTGDGLGAEQNVSVRGSLLFNPSDRVEIYLKAQFSSDEDDNPTPRKGRDCTIPYQADFPEPSVVGAPQPAWTQFPNWFDSCDPFETTISTPTYLGKFFLERDITTLTAEITWDFGDGLTLTSVTGYLDGDSNYLIDAHGGPNNSMFQSTQNDGSQLSQEFRIDNQGSDSTTHWLAGVYFLDDEQIRDDQNIFYVDDAVGDPQPPSGFRPEGRDVKQQINDTRSLGIFGELTFDVSDRVSLAIGGRYSEDDKDYGVAHYGWGWGGPIAGLTDGIDADDDGVLDNQCMFGPGGPPTWGLRFCGDPQNPVGFVTPVTSSGSWDNFSGKASLSYAINDDHMVYGLISQGYKTGGFQNEPFNPSDAVIPYDEETVINYEIGFKGTFNERFRIYATAFFTDYEDLQMFLFRTSATGDFNQVTENAANVEITGVELDYAWQVTDNFRFSGTFAFIDSELKDAFIDTDGDGIPEDFSGTRPDNTPDFSGTAIAEYTVWLGSDASIILRADWRGLSDVFDDIGEQADRRHDSYDVFGARATWVSADEDWSVAVWGRNLGDEAYTINVGPPQPNVNQLNFMYGQPRSYGVVLTRNF